MKKIIVSIFILCFPAFLWASGYEFYGIYPAHWWVGMKNPNLQVMIHAEEIASAKISINYPGASIKKINRFSNTSYLIIDLAFSSNVRPGTIKIHVKSEGYEGDIDFPLKARNNENGKTRIRGITSEDLIYLIMPDRFSNGDPSNDKVPGMRDQSLNRDTIFERHGGDLKGIRDHLDYLQDLGVTALWLNPVIENDMPNRTEHGYAFTNHYRIDRRLGGEQAYHDLINDIHRRGMKIIQDAVYNHVGIEHFLFRDMPDSSWFHKWPVYTNTTYKDQTLMDPYASALDRTRMSDGWFVPSMPDINQQNPFFATFLIQHAIWSTEEFGLDGWRIDTYAYNDLEFMNRCNKALLDEYPGLHMFGETWVHGVLNQAYFAQNNLSIPFKSNLPAVTDFQAQMYGIIPALTQSFGWTEGVNKLYSTLANDFVYKDPMKNVIFLDNHDMSRFYSQVQEDLKKYKMGIAWLLTSRGIPQLYYGTEILMAGISNPDGWVRLDFKGGWIEDKENKFTHTGRTEQENDAFDYVKSLANFRKNSSAIKSGRMMQYVPEEGVYTYFRYDDKQTVMIVMNTGTNAAKPKWENLQERTKDFTKIKDAVTGQIISLSELNVQPYECFVGELTK